MPKQFLHKARVARLLSKSDPEAVAQALGAGVIALDPSLLHHRPDVFGRLGSTPRPQFGFAAILGFLLLSYAVHQFQCVQVMIRQRYRSIGGLVTLFQGAQPQRFGGQVHVLESEL